MYIAKSTCILLTTATIAEAFCPSSSTRSRITSLPGRTRTDADANDHARGIILPCTHKGESSVCDRLAANHNYNCRLPLHLHMSMSMSMSSMSMDTFSEVDSDVEDTQDSSSSSVISSSSASSSLKQKLQLQNGTMNTRTATSKSKSKSNSINRKKKKSMGRISIDFESNTSTSTNANANANASAINTGKKDLSSPSIEILKTNQSRNQNQNRNQNPITFSSESYGNGLRLTKEEEVELCQSIQELKAIMQTRDQLAMDLANAHEHAHAHTEEHAQDETNKNWNTLIAIKRPFLPTPTEEEWALACNNISTPHELKLKLLHGKESRAKLVSYNLGLVLQIAKRYDYELKKSIASGGGNGVGTILTCSDLIQEGNMGLLEAAERFDAGRGVRFATYAGYWVKQRILRAITENSRVIRLPAHVHTTLRTIRRARSEMQKIIGREPSLPELSHHLSIPIEKIRLYNDSSRSTISLNSPLNPSSGGGGSGTGLSNSKGDSGSNNASISASGEMDRRTLGDKIAFDGPTPEEDAEMQSLKRDIRDVIDGLGSERERDVLFFRFGLEGAGEPCTLEETGRRLGISRERVKVIENRALNKLRHPQRNYRLKEYVEEGNHGHGNGNGNGLGYVYGVSPPPASVGGQQQLGNNGKGQEWQKEAVGIDLYGEQRMDTMTKKRGGKKSVRKGKDGDALAKQRPEQIWSF